MGKYVLKRIFMLIPTILVIVFIVFAIMDMTPSDPASLILGTKASEAAKLDLNKQLGMDRPFIVRYGDYVIQAAQSELGTSWRNGRPVYDEIITRFPSTIKLAVAAIVLAMLIGIPLGVLSAVKQYSIFDMIGTTAAMFMAAVPSFWFGLIAILIFALKLHVLPSNGDDSWLHFILPSITLAIPETAGMLRLTRTTMLETIRQDYIRTARAKGQTEWKVIFRHALPNALLPVITSAGMAFGGLLGGVVTIETVFAINGVGSLILTGIQMKDIPVVTGCAVVLALLFMLVMLFVDIMYAYIDPRIRARYSSK
ncbi:ABC transporter permease [Sporomusa termitida]|uniref:Glutathione transport system permease protein GsiC n=1 Tax=Sporomusa termitida TaxID=2377 RepID=A0A517DV24_9FIRM|nr:ABC transporter permease [Sporomusa termitida]QDR81214.1 Glutathione transport system permease protein GsiC [Sporomusa termitida]